MNKRQHSTTAGRQNGRLTVLGTELTYRTVSLPEKRAKACLAMFSANPHFIGAELVPDPKRVGFAYVAFVPASSERQVDMMGRFSVARQQRADAAVGLWIWAEDNSFCCTPHKARGGDIVWNTYRVTDTSCECDDFKFRCSRICCACKHMLKRQERIARAAELAATVRCLNETGALPTEQPGQFGRPLPSIHDRRAMEALFG